MGFTDNLKRSLGFEETESSEKKEQDGTSLTDVFSRIWCNNKI